MRVELEPIISHKNITLSHPWYAYDVDLVKGELTLALAKDALLQGKKVCLKPLPGHELETHVLAVTLDRQVEWVPISKQKPVYWAHLGFWDPATDTLRLLEFQEAPLGASEAA